MPSSNAQSIPPFRFAPFGIDCYSFVSKSSSQAKRITMNDQLQLRDFLGPIAILISAAIAVGAIVTNFCINWRNRRIRAALDLYSSYNSKDFTTSRYQLYQQLNQSLLDQNATWDYEELGKQAFLSSDEKLLNNQIALNQVVAFYNALRHLIFSKEIDEGFVRDKFAYAYSYWDPFRKRFYEGTCGSAKLLFEPIKFFDDPGHS